MSSRWKGREELLEALSRGIRDFSDQDVLFSQASADRLGLNLTDLKCLSILERTGAMTAGKLAEVTGLTSGAVTGLIDRLEKAGWARRVRNPKDRRHVIIEAVAERGADIDRLFSESRSALADIVSDYTEEQIGLVLDFLDRSSAMLRDETVKLRAVTEPKGTNDAGEFSGPLGTLTHARLKFISGASQVTLRASPGIPELYTARFEGRAPTVKEEAGTVSIQYPRFMLLDWRKLAADVLLNGSIPWQLELRGGVSKLNADLRDLLLESIELSSGASDVTMRLPKPSGTVPIRVAGGVSHVTFLLPEGTAARLLVKGGVSALAFNEQSLGGVGGQTSLETPGYKHATDRFDFEIAGGASDLTVESR
ncbi:MarR family winged helix-turn-helix transcriptional regulator [Stigmatella aurantiaca]|nr:MarR family transcriptional regulator [Stigmatella aurantiaca]